MEVRVATIHDAQDLFALNVLFENITTIGALEKALAGNDREVVCVAFVEGVAAGYCSGLIVRSMCYDALRADVESLYVKEEHRRQGIGEALLTCLEKALATRGIHHFHINTHTNNTSAQRLYEKLGYTKTGEILLDKSAPTMAVEG